MNYLLGYYDHGLHFLKQLKLKSSFKHELKLWKKNILKHVRNPHFRNFKNFLKALTIRITYFQTAKILKE